MAFRDIIGQERAIRALKTVARQDNIPHAFLFSGLPGVGKKTVALDFAKVINCANRVEDDCCEECSACVRASGRIFPDLVVIETSEQYIGIDEIRALEEELSFPPLEGRRRVIVIDDAQKMTDEAANALLKTLEEPPPGNVIILISPEPNMLLSTVVSRTCHLRFQPLSEEAVAEILISRQLLEETDARLVAKISSGSVEKALSYLESQFIHRRQVIKDRVLEVLSCDINRLFEIAREWGTESEFLLDDIDMLKMWWRDLIICEVGGNDEFVIDPAAVQGFEEILQKSSYTGLVDSYRLFDSIYVDIKRRSNKQMALERLVLGLRESINEKDSGCSF